MSVTQYQSMIFSINISNINNIGRYHKVNIVSGATKPVIVSLIYSESDDISESIDISNHDL